jgi:hypothetical protein
MSARSASAALQLNCGPKVERGAGEKFEDFETHFRIKLCYRLVKFHGAPHKVPNYMGGGASWNFNSLKHYFIRK